MHLKPTAGCQISALIFGFWGGTLYISPEKLPKDGQGFCHLGQSVKGPGNTFNLSPKWAKTLQLLIYFSRDMHRVLHPNPNIKVDI
jgi:hypothetical protein